MIVISIIIILAMIALAQYNQTVLAAREATLRDDLHQMRKLIDQYAADKGKLPQSIDDLVAGKYLREKPMDPILEKAEWKEIQGEDSNSPDGEQGLIDVKSVADGEDREGKRYEDY